MPTLKSLDKKYSFYTGFNLSYLELDNFAEGTTTSYVKISTIRGTYPNYEREPKYKGFIFDDFKWFIAVNKNNKGNYIYKECQSPYK